MSLRSVPTGKAEPLTRQVYSFLIGYWEAVVEQGGYPDEIRVPTRAELAKGKLPYTISDSGYLPSPGRGVLIDGEHGSLTMGQVLDDVNAKGNKSSLGQQFMSRVKSISGPGRWNTTFGDPPRPPVVARTGITTAYTIPDGRIYVPDPPPGDPVWQKYHGQDPRFGADEVVKQAKGADPKPGRLAGQLESIKGGKKGGPPASWAPGWGEPLPYKPARWDVIQGGGIAETAEQRFARQLGQATNAMGRDLDMPSMNVMKDYHGVGTGRIPSYGQPPGIPATPELSGLVDQLDAARRKDPARFAKLQQGRTGMYPTYIEGLRRDVKAPGSVSPRPKPPRLNAGIPKAMVDYRRLLPGVPVEQSAHVLSQVEMFGNPLSNRGSSIYRNLTKLFSKHGRQIVTALLKAPK
jgi:hypothetical protein